MFYHQKLKCYRMSLEVAKKVPSLMARWPSGGGYLQDQLRRAIGSVLLNTAEGNGRISTKERRRFFDIARASANEVAAIMDWAHAMGWMEEPIYREITDSLLQIVKMLFKLS